MWEDGCNYTTINFERRILCYVRDEIRNLRRLISNTDVSVLERRVAILERDNLDIKRGVIELYETIFPEICSDSSSRALAGRLTSDKCNIIEWIKTKLLKLEDCCSGEGADLSKIYKRLDDIDSAIVDLKKCCEGEEVDLSEILRRLGDVETDTTGLKDLVYTKTCPVNVADNYGVHVSKVVESCSKFDFINSDINNLREKIDDINIDDINKRLISLADAMVKYDSYIVNSDLNKLLRNFIVSFNIGEVPFDYSLDSTINAYDQNTDAMCYYSLYIIKDFKNSQSYKSGSKSINYDSRKNVLNFGGTLFYTTIDGINLTINDGENEILTNYIFKCLFLCYDFKLKEVYYAKTLELTREEVDNQYVIKDSIEWVRAPHLSLDDRFIDGDFESNNNIVCSVRVIPDDGDIIMIDKHRDLQVQQSKSLIFDDLQLIIYNLFIDALIDTNQDNMLTDFNWLEDNSQYGLLTLNMVKMGDLIGNLSDRAVARRDVEWDIPNRDNSTTWSPSATMFTWNRLILNDISKVLSQKTDPEYGGWLVPYFDPINSNATNWLWRELDNMLGIENLRTVWSGYANSRFLVYDEVFRGLVNMKLFDTNGVPELINTDVVIEIAHELMIDYDEWTDKDFVSEKGKQCIASAYKSGKPLYYRTLANDMSAFGIDRAAEDKDLTHVIDFENIGGDKFLLALGVYKSDSQAWWQKSKFISHALGYFKCKGYTRLHIRARIKDDRLVALARDKESEMIMKFKMKWKLGRKGDQEREIELKFDPAVVIDQEKGKIYGDWVSDEWHDSEYRPNLTQVVDSMYMGISGFTGFNSELGPFFVTSSATNNELLRYASEFGHDQVRYECKGVPSIILHEGNTVDISTKTVAYVVSFEDFNAHSVGSAIYLPKGFSNYVDLIDVQSKKVNALIQAIMEENSLISALLNDNMRRVECLEGIVNAIQDWVERKISEETINNDAAVISLIAEGIMSGGGLLSAFFPIAGVITQIAGSVYMAAAKFSQGDIPGGAFALINVVLGIGMMSNKYKNYLPNIKKNPAKLKEFSDSILNTPDYRDMPKGVIDAISKNEGIMVTTGGFGTFNNKLNTLIRKTIGGKDSVLSKALLSKRMHPSHSALEIKKTYKDKEGVIRRLNYSIESGGGFVIGRGTNFIGNFKYYEKWNEKTNQFELDVEKIPYSDNEMYFWASKKYKMKYEDVSTKYTREELWRRMQKHYSAKLPQVGINKNAFIVKRQPLVADVDTAIYTLDESIKLYPNYNLVLNNCQDFATDHYRWITQGIRPRFYSNDMYSNVVRKIILDKQSPLNERLAGFIDDVLYTNLPPILM